MRDKRLVWLLGGVLVIGGYWLYTRFGSAHLVIESEPDGAIVRVDRRQIGITPLRTSVPAGRHLLEVQHSHYAPHTETVDLSRGDVLEKRVVMRAGRGTLTLLSNPKGAWVEVDGERLSEITPTRHETESGEVLVRMGLPERFPVEETVTLKADTTLEVNLNLNIDPHGSLTVSVRPRDATVALPELELDYEPGVRVPIGEHLVRVSRRGYVTREIRHKVVYGENLTRVDLVREYGPLSVSVTPADAEVLVSFRDENGAPQRLAYERGMRVPVGKVEVRARAMGYRTGFSEFRLTGKGHSMKLNLSTIDVEAGSVMRDDLAAGGQGPELVVIPSGTFVMGNPDGPPSELPTRSVTITQPFAMSVHELTIEDYARYATAANKALNKRLDGVDPREPIRYVSWEDANRYAAWLTEQTGAKYRLPTEAEWEYAARAGSSADYFFGDDSSQACTYANIADRTTREIYRDWKVENCEDGHRKLAPVGTLEANPFGLHDIYGNVSEWVAECGMPPYAGAATDGSEVGGEYCGSHGFRGGSWDSQADEFRSAYRNTASVDNDDRGIRLLREL